MQNMNPKVDEMYKGLISIVIIYSVKEQKELKEREDNLSTQLKVCERKFVVDGSPIMVRNILIEILPMSRFGTILSTQYKQSHKTWLYYFVLLQKLKVSY